MTKDEIEAALAKLTRYDDGGDFEGGYMMHKRQNGMYVVFEDVRAMMESIDAVADELKAEKARLDFLIEKEAYAWGRKTWKVSQAAEDGADLSPEVGEFKTAREAIDAARQAGRDGE